MLWGKYKNLRGLTKLKLIYLQLGAAGDAERCAGSAKKCSGRTQKERKLNQRTQSRC